MKKKFFFIIFLSQYAISQNPTQTVQQNWNNVLTEKFDEPPTYTNNIVNLPNWKFKHGESRWAQQQIFIKDQVDISDGSLILK